MAKRKSVTDVFMIIDKSGSMDELAADTIGGFNSYIQSLIKDTKHEFFVTATLFDTTIKPYCINKAPADVPAMDTASYRAYGNTALLDAVGFTIGNVTYIHPNDKVIVVIMTDGFENASREETSASVARKVKDREAQGWEFIYIGQGVDQWAQASRMGVNNYVGTLHTNSGTRSTYEGLSAATSAYAGGSKIGETISIIETEVKKNG